MVDAAVIEPVAVAPALATPATPPAADAGKPADPSPSASLPAGADPAPSAEPSADAPGKWDGWREEMAGGNEDIAKLVNRYGSLKGVAKALFEREQLIRSGKVKQDAPDPADEKAVAAWRKAEGVPEDATGYKATQIKGFEWTDADKPLLATFFEKSHAKGLPQATVDAMLGSYAELQQDMQARQAEADKAAETTFEDKMRQSWGREYRGNWNLAQRWLKDTPVGAALANAVMPDGRMLGHIPEFAEWAAQQGRERYGDAAFIPGDVAAKGAGRLEEIGKMRRDNPDAYWRDKKVQAEELDLIDRELKSKKAAAR